MKVLQASDFTRSVYEQFYDLVRQAQAEDMTAEEFVQRAEAIDPKLGEAAKKVAGPKAAMAVALALLLAALNSCKLDLNANLDVNQLIEQVLSKGPVASGSDHGTKP
jgi:hypothetical protein